MYNSNTFIFLFLYFWTLRDASNNSAAGLDIRVNGDGTNAELNVKGENTFNSNFYGISTFPFSNANLDINVESGATLKSCGNVAADIYGDVFDPATATFLGDGYTCDQIQFFGDGTVTPPNCQPCPP